VTWLDVQSAAIAGADLGAARALSAIRPTIEGLQKQVADLTKALADAARAHEDIERRLQESTANAVKREADIVREARMATLELVAQHRGLDGAPGAPGPAGRDGALGVPVPWAPGIKHLHGDLTVHRGGLFVALTDTTTQPGEPGSEWRCVLAGLASVDVASDGDSFNIEAKLSDGTVRRAQARLPGVRYKGVFSPDEKYDAGDACTQQGSVWIATESGSKLGTPGVGASGWKLAVKRGVDGRDVKPVPERPHFFHEFLGRAKAGDIVRHGPYCWLCIREVHEAPARDHASWVKLGA
jgi:hypothetical protein